MSWILKRMSTSARVLKGVAREISMIRGEIFKRDPTQTFCLSDYDCIGFDLDNTILRYNVDNIIKLVYGALAKFLVEEKGYAAEFLFQSVEGTNLHFFQKGLALDCENGNILKLAPSGSVLKASHGSKMMDDVLIDQVYGIDRCTNVTSEYAQNILGSWNGPFSDKIRGLLDYFDLPVSLVFARCVDSIDSSAMGGPVERYSVYTDILEGLISMYSYDKFGQGTGGFFGPIKENPQHYLFKCSPTVKRWLKDLKGSKKTFLITGSYFDFASFTATFCLGEDWLSYFDIVICYARKPGFFTVNRPFLQLDGKELNESQCDKLEQNGIYFEGNWQALYNFFKKELGNDSPKCIYFGDNIVQDVLAVDECTCCDAVAISEEMKIEGVGEDKTGIETLSYNLWGSYFGDLKNKNTSLWSEKIKKHARICVPSLDVLADKPMNFEIQSFHCKSPNSSQPIGYFPKSPY